MTPTQTFTPTLTPTITLTPTVTLTPTITLTPVPPLLVWPNPFNPNRSVGGVMKAYFMPAGSSIAIYTVSGEMVVEIPETNGIALWYGRNRNGAFVSPGIYFYVVRSGDQQLLSGKLMVLTN